MGLLAIPYNQEIIFAGSMTIVLFLMAKLLTDLSQAVRHTFLGTAIIIFVFRALPTPGPVQPGGRSMFWVSMINSSPSWP
jgi:hypothetical protein